MIFSKPHLFILLTTICLTSCKNESKQIDFDTLIPEVINSKEDSVTTASGIELPLQARISSASNKYDIRNQLLAFGDSLCRQCNKKLETIGIHSFDLDGRLTEFANKLLSNESNQNSTEIDLEGERLEYKHVKTEYSNLKFQFRSPEDGYRYLATIHYHFKLSLNRIGDKAEGMKHLVYVADGIIYSSKKLH